METPAQILEALKANPENAYILDGYDAMYVPFHGDAMFCFVGDFHGMNTEQINAYIQNAMKEAAKEGVDNVDD